MISGHGVYLIVMTGMMALSVIAKTVSHSYRSGQFPFRSQQQDAEFELYERRLGRFALFEIALVLATLAAWRWLGSTLVALSVGWVRYCGAVGITLGYLLVTIAYYQMGASWRLGVDYDSEDRLVTSGLFRFTRNPIYLGLDLFVISAFLIVPRAWSATVMVAVVALWHWEIRQEERFLSTHYGDQYGEFCNSVGRYLTWGAVRL